MSYFYILEKPRTSGVPNWVLQDTEMRIFKPIKLAQVVGMWLINAFITNEQ